MRVGTRFIFRDGRAKGIGKIVRILPSFQSPGEAQALPKKDSIFANASTSLAAPPMVAAN
jgi:hypothetical protein